MVGTQSGNTLRLPECSGRGDEDAEQHWFLCEAIWTDKETGRERDPIGSKWAFLSIGMEKRKRLLWNIRLTYSTIVA
jgi:hypothetical protein